MTCIETFCDRLDDQVGDHSCELRPDHDGPCRCVCEECLAPADSPPATAGTTA